MKVLFIGHTYIPEINREKLKYLSKKVDLTLLTPKKWRDDLFTVSAKKDRELKHFTSSTVMDGHEKAYFYFPNIFSRVREIKPDVIHVEQGADSVSLFQAIWAKKLFCPNAKIVFFTWMNLDLPNPFCFNLIEKFNLKNTDFAFCGNADAVKILRKHGYVGPVTVLPQLGVNPRIFRKKLFIPLRKKLGLKEYFTIGFFGRIVKEKGLLVLIKALKNLSGKWKFLIIGRGELTKEIIARAAKYGFADKIVMLESVPHIKIVDYINCLDAYILPSLTVPWWKEQFGHVLIEAMACEVPVIGSSSGEIPNIIDDAGLVFKEGNAEDLRRKIELLMKSPALRRKYVKLGRKRVLENYTDEILAEKIYEVYKKLLRQKA